MEEHKPDFFKIVVLSGGGTKGLLTLGALQYYYEKGYYDMEKVEIYCGTSIGAVISLLLICGYPPLDIFTEIYKTDNFFEIPENVQVMDLVHNMGILPIESFTNKIKDMIENKFESVPTLLELKELTGKTLITTASNITKMRCEYYSPDTHPNLSCLRAVELSSSLPILFQRIRHEGDYITDGGLMDNFPLIRVDDGVSKILAIAISKEYEDISFPEDEEFIRYFHRLIMLPMWANIEVKLKTYSSNTTLVVIKYKERAVFEINVDDGGKLQLFLLGYQTAENKSGGAKSV
jgi:predicted acylesterase/phospholipase RssA